MGTSVIANGLNTLVKNTAKLVGKMQIGINKILWGVNNRQPSIAVKLTDTTTRTFQQDGQLESESTKTKYAFTQKTPAPAPPGKGENLLTAGLFNALDISKKVATDVPIKPLSILLICEISTPISFKPISQK